MISNFRSAGLLISFLAGSFIVFSFHCKPVEKNVGTAEQHIYSIHVESSGYSDIKKMYSVDSLGEKRPFFKSETIQATDIDFTATLKKTILKLTDKNQLLVYELQSPVISLKNNELPVEISRLSAELTKPFFVEEDKTGKIIFLQSDSLITSTAKSFQKEIVAQLQFVKPDYQDSMWQSEEENARGVYLANYFLEKKDTVKKNYKKVVKQYETINASQKKQKADIDMEGRFITTNSGLLTNATVSVAEITMFNKDTVSALASRIQVDYKYSRVITGDSIRLVLELCQSISYKSKQSLNTASSDEDILHAAYRATLGNDSWPSLLEKLKKATAFTTEQKKELVLKFRSLFYLQPENCSKAAVVLYSENPESERFQLLTNALAITENQNATDAIADIIVKRRAEVTLIATLFPPLATTIHPTRKAAEQIMQIAFPKGINDTSFIAATAQLTVAAMVNKFQKSDSAYAEQFISVILKKIDLVKDTLQKILVWGNLGSDRVLPLLQQIIKELVASEDVRNEAIIALKFIPSKDVDRLLTELLRGRNKNLQVAARQVLEFRKDNLSN